MNRSVFLNHLRRIPFIRDLKLVGEPPGGSRRADGILRLKTAAKNFELSLETKTGYFSRSTLSGFLARTNAERKSKARPILLFARHIGRMAGEQLIEHQINFVDLAGNIHLELGASYHWTVLGIPEPKPAREAKAVTPAHVQLLFTFAADPKSVELPVRIVGDLAGISKSSVANIRFQFVDEGLLTRAGRRFRLGDSRAIPDRLVSGYSQILRPKLAIGRFRYSESSAEKFLDRLKEGHLRYALSGAPAAELLQHYYHAAEIPVFIAGWAPDIPRQLRLLPDREGPVHVLRPFGEVVFWREEQGRMLAPPWLIYAELLNAEDPRAHEAAEEFRRVFLP